MINLSGLIMDTDTDIELSHPKRWFIDDSNATCDIIEVTWGGVWGRSDIFIYVSFSLYSDLLNQCNIPHEIYLTLDEKPGADLFNEYRIYKSTIMGRDNYIQLTDYYRGSESPIALTTADLANIIKRIPDPSKPDKFGKTWL